MGDSKIKIAGKVSRKANVSGAPRIYGNLELQNWIQKHFQLKDTVNVHIVSPDTVWITRD